MSLLKLWNIFICLLTSAVAKVPDEVKNVKVGNDIVMELKKLSEISTLYHYDQKVADLVKSNSVVCKNTHFYGRLNCINDDLNKKNTIIIQNVTQRYAGLYKVVHDTDESKRRFLKIKDRPTFAILGENVTIGWFYNEQGQNRTLRILHPNKAVMMILQSNNIPRIQCNFLQRVTYFGNISRSYVSLTLLNVERSDSGFYTIETQHGNIMTGRKELILKHTNITRTTNIVTTLNTYSIVTPLRNVSTKIRRSPPSSVSFSHTVRPKSSSPEAQISTKDSVTTTNKSSAELHPDEPCNDSTSPTVGPSSPGVQNFSLAVPVYYVIPVVTGALGVIVVMIGCLIWIQRKNSYSLEAVQRRVEECATASFATPSTIRRPLPIHARNEGTMGGSVPQSNALYNAMFGLHHSGILTDSVSVDTMRSSIYSLAKFVDDKERLDNIVNWNEPSERSDEKALTAYDDDTEEGIFGECPSVLTLVSAAGNEEHIYSNIADGNGQRQQVFQSIQSLYAKVKKGPRFSSRNNNDFADTRKTDGLCGDEYEMVDISRGVDPNKTFQDFKIAAESTQNQTPVSDDGDTLEIKDEEPTEQ